MEPENPYNWTGDRPKHFVRREELLQQALETCRQGGAFILMGTRGMGKSAFLEHLEKELRKLPELEIILFSGPPPTEKAVGAIVGELRDKLVAAASKRGAPDLGQAFHDAAQKFRLQEMLNVYLGSMPEGIERLVLLYDELDDYANIPPNGGQAYFNPLENARKKLSGRLAVVAAGGLGLLSLKTVLGSSIFTRAGRKILEPFRDDELLELAKPFADRGAALPQDVLSALRLASGGNLALATYGLQHLWPVTAPSVGDVMKAFAAFRDNHDDFGASIRGAMFGSAEPEAPFHVWVALKDAGGSLTRAAFDQARQLVTTSAAMERKDILDMLRASGFIRMDDAAGRSDPIVAEIIPSILTFEDSSQTRTSLRHQLRADLVEALAEIHRMTPAFYEQSSKGKGQAPKILPEAVFSAALALHMGSRGWKTELEPMTGAGFVDIKVRHPRFSGESGLIEVKIWPRNDYKAIHAQIVSYFSQGTTALATVVVTDNEKPDWKTEYESTCLTGKVAGSPTWKPLYPPLEGYFEAPWAAGLVEHFLLRLALR